MCKRVGVTPFAEAAWQAAEAGCDVMLHEMRPVRPTAVHQTGKLAELVAL